MKFKVGDKVRQTKPYCYGGKIKDKVGIVDNIDYRLLFPIDVKHDGIVGIWFYTEDELELVD